MNWENKISKDEKASKEEKRLGVYVMHAHQRLSAASDPMALEAQKYWETVPGWSWAGTFTRRYTPAEEVGDTEVVCVSYRVRAVDVSVV